MQTGTKVSAIGHGALIALAVFGLPWFGPRERDPIRVTEVSFVSESDFKAAQAASDAPREETAPATPPRARPAPAPVPAPAPASEVAEEAPEAPDQQVAVLQPPPAEAPRIEPRIVTVEPPTAAAPPARPAVRVEPDETPPPEESLRPAEVPVPVRAPEPAAEVEPEETPAAPEAAAPAPAPEAVPEAPLALVTSTRPLARPDRPQRKPDEAETVMAALKREVEKEQQRRVATPEKPAPKPAAKPAAKPAPAEDERPASQGTSTAAATSLPSGPPMTGAEKDGLKLAVQRCWNVPAGLRDAQELKVTLAAELNADGSVVNASIRMIEPNPAPDARFKSAFDAGRRALIRCSPYADLPREKYGQWRNIEVVFNPEGMVSW